MKLMGLLALAGLTTSVSATALYAADYYVQAITPGAVQGTPLAVVNLQADLPADEDSYGDDSTDQGVSSNDGADDSTEASGDAASQDAVNDGSDAVTAETETVDAPASGTETVGKWLKAPKQVSSERKTVTVETQAKSATQGLEPNVRATLAVATTNPAAAANATSSYPSFSALMKAGVVKGGDRVLLMSGYHGAISVNGMRFTSNVTVMPAPGQVAHVDSIDVMGSSNVVFDGLKVWARSVNAGSIALVRTYANSSNVTFTNMDVRSVANAAGYMGWTLADWKTNRRGGFLVDGSNISVINNRLTGLANVIFALGPRALIENNVIDGWGDDATRALGDGSTLRGNKMQNCFHISSNHDDGFQSFSRGAGGKVGTGTVYNLTIENNKIYEWHTTATNPVRCKLQGIGMFDGMYENVIVRNNVVSVSGYHGIAIAGAKNALITQNTVVSSSGAVTGYPWIKVTPHKNGTASTLVTAANNTTNAMKVKSDPAKKNIAVNNTVVTNFANEFNAASLWDYQLRATAKSANAGSAAYATPADIVGVPRPKGKGPDAGAFESQ